MQTPLPSLRPAGLATVAWMSAWAGLLWWTASPRDLVGALISAAPALLAVVLATTSQAERSAYLLRLLACSLMLPLLQLMLADGQDWPASGVLLFALAGVHLLCLLGALTWAASATTALPASGPGQAAGTLARRLMALPSLTAAGLPLRVRPPADLTHGVWVIDLPAPEGRSHQVLLEMDPASRQVAVRERTAADGARPIDADEASLRRPGDPLIDAARPDAQRVWSRSALATTLEADQLAAVALSFDNAGDLSAAVLAPLPAFAADPGRAGVALLAALVTRSGWSWRPRLFGGAAV